ncbi:hypothetical protein AB0D59_14720 [Streptomyces sp. NPDC048417]|uniref:hypothetical protein n=1 Tax=Streptomyces sp. NPDC048417 TaxID=3155387 RepID=UPI00342CEDCC
MVPQSTTGEASGRSRASRGAGLGFGAEGGGKSAEVPLDGGLVAVDPLQRDEQAALEPESDQAVPGP